MPGASSDVDAGSSGGGGGHALGGGAKEEADALRLDTWRALEDLFFRCAQFTCFTSSFRGL